MMTPEEACDAIVKLFVKYYGGATFSDDFFPNVENLIRQSNADAISKAEKCTKEYIDQVITDAVNAAMGWQPIETAPKDGIESGEGTLVDLWSDSEGRVPNCFYDKDGLGKWMQVIKHYAPGKRMTQFREVTDPTHWMPLPQPPEVRE